MEDKHFLQLMKEAREVRLDPKDKSRIKNALEILINKKNVKTTFASYVWTCVVDSFKLATSKPVIIAATVLLVLGGSISVSAREALPGDTLYLVKIAFNEEIGGWFALSDEAKANWHASLAAKRLEEGEELATSGGLSSAARIKLLSDFDGHVADAQNRIYKIETKKVNIANDVTYKFDLSLETHDVALSEIIASVEVDDDSKTEIESLRLKVSQTRQDIGRYREKIKIQHETKVEGLKSTPISTPIQEIKVKSGGSLDIEVESEGIGETEDTEESEDADNKEQVDHKSDTSIRGEVNTGLDI